MQHLDDGYLQAWLDRDRSGITGKEAAEVESHLADCEVCAARLAELEGTSEQVRSLLAATGPGAEAAPDFEDVVRRARRRDPPARRSPRWMAVGWAASLVFAVGLGWLTHDFVRQGGADTPTGADASAAEVARAEPDATGQAAPVTEPATQQATEQQAAPATEQATAQQATGQEAAQTGQEAERAAAQQEAEQATAQARAPGPPEDTVVPDPEVTIAPTTFGDAEARAASPGPLLVQGRVRAPDGRPLASAQVTIPGAPIGTMTGADGTFTLSLPAEALATDDARPVALTAQLLGYRSATQEIEPGAADSLSVDFLLEETTVAMDEVLVRGAGQAPAAEALRARELGDPTGVVHEVWSPVPRGRAEAEAGFELLTVPGLQVLEIELGEIAHLRALRVRQALESGAVLTLVQWTAGGAAMEPTLPEGQPVERVERGEVRVTGTAPIPADSLRVLLERLR